MASASSPGWRSRTARSASAPIAEDSSDGCKTADVNELVHLPTGPLDLSLTLSCLSRGRGDPCHRSDAAGVWRSWQTPEGAATVRLEQRGPAVRAVAWGPGADWALAAVPDLLGGRDDPLGFLPTHPLLREL